MSVATEAPLCPQQLEKTGLGRNENQVIQACFKPKYLHDIFTVASYSFMILSGCLIPDDLFLYHMV